MVNLLHRMKVHALIEPWNLRDTASKGRTHDGVGRLETHVDPAASVWLNRRFTDPSRVECIDDLDDQVLHQLGRIIHEITAAIDRQLRVGGNFSAAWAMVTVRLMSDGVRSDHAGNDGSQGMWHRLLHVSSHDHRHGPDSLQALDAGG